MQDYILNILVIFESVLLLVISLILFSKTRNLTRLKKYEEAFIEEQAKKHSEQNEFFPMVIHELRSPLSVISGAADLLIKTTDELSAEQIHTLLHQIKSSSSGLLKIVGDILDISKMEGGKFQINETYGDIRDVLREECGYFEPLAKVKNVALSCPVLEEIPSFSFDSDRVKQVLNNLIANSIKFCPEKGKVVVNARKDARSVIVEVADDGVGIPDKDKPMIFHKFFQASNQAGVGEKGTGLGLAICKGIIEAHGGKIWMEDNKPSGVKFIFSLPLK